ncbi:hypothetical protein DY000_02005377, partial [Brassica cretica]
LISETIVLDEKGKFDELVEEKVVRILVEPKSLMHVIGTKMDFIDDKLRYANPVTLKTLCLFYESLCSSILTTKVNAGVVNRS